MNDQSDDSIALKHLKEDAEFTVEIANAKIDTLVAALRGFNLAAHRIVGAQGDEIVVRLPRAAFVAAAEALAPYGAKP